MECSCGSETKDNKSVSKKANLTWEFIECKACHKIGNDVLKDYDGAVIICYGIEARRKYDEMTKDEKVKKTKSKEESIEEE